MTSTRNSLHDLLPSTDLDEDEFSHNHTRISTTSVSRHSNNDLGIDQQNRQTSITSSRSSAELRRSRISRASQDALYNKPLVMIKYYKNIKHFCHYLGLFFHL